MLDMVADGGGAGRAEGWMVAMPPPAKPGWSPRPGPKTRSQPGSPVADAHFSTPVTGGYDPLIRLWNPFFSKKPLWLMKGHQTSVTHILVNSNNNSILLSISKDKVSPSGSLALMPPTSFSSPAKMPAVGRSPRPRAVL